MFERRPPGWASTRKSPDITDQPGVLMSELHEREVDGEEEVAERRARATDGKEAEVVAVAGRWEGLAA